MSNKFLYPCFNKWRGSIWFIADTHFDDVKIEKLRGISAETLVKNINKKVTKHDTLVILGDVGNIEYVKQLKAGYKVLILGNHDNGASNYQKNINNKLFDEVYEGQLTIRKNIILSHEPADFPFALNIHGHDHNGTDFKNYVLINYDADMDSQDMTKNYLEVIKANKLTKFNVCAEWIGSMPVSLKTILQSGILKNIDDIHRLAIDKAKDHKKY